MNASLYRRYCLLVLLVLLPREAGACRYTVRDVAMVDLAKSRYVLFLVTEKALAPALADSLAAVAAPILTDSNVEFRLLDSSQLVDGRKGKGGRLDKGQQEKNPPTLKPLETSIPAAPGPLDIASLGITSYPAAVLLAPDGRTLRLPLAESGSSAAGTDDSKQGPNQGPVQVAALRKLLRSAIESPRRDALLHYLLRGHSIVLVVEGTDGANNRRAISWAQEAIARVRTALPTMAKPIALPPRMMRLSPAEAKRERVLLWSLGVDLFHEDPRTLETPRIHAELSSHGMNPSSGLDSPIQAQRAKSARSGKFSEQPPAHGHAEAAVAQIALLFGRGRKLGPVLRIPGARQQDLWRSLGVVGEDCECGLDRSWMRGPMIPHAWSTADEAEAVAALGFDPGNPLVKAEISRILVRGPGLAQRAQAEGVRASASGARQPLQDPLQPQLQLMEIDIDALAAAADGRADESTSSSSQLASASALTAGGKPSTSAPKQAGRLPAYYPATTSPVQEPPGIESSAAGRSISRRTAASQRESGQTANLARTANNLVDGTSVARGVVAWVLAALALVGVSGSLMVLLLGRRKQA